MNENRPTDDEIRLRAYEIYLNRGGRHGWDQDDWFQAERELTQEAARAPKGTAKKRDGQSA